MQAVHQHFSAKPVHSNTDLCTSFILIILDTWPSIYRGRVRELRAYPPPPYPPSFGRSDRVRETHPRTNQTRGAGGVQKPTVAVTAEFPMAHNFPVHAVHDGNTNEKCFSDPEIYFKPIHLYKLPDLHMSAPAQQVAKVDCQPWTK